MLSSAKEIADFAVVFGEHVRVSRRRAERCVASRLLHFHDAAAGVESVANKAVSSVVDRQRRDALAAEAAARHLEAFPRVAAINWPAEGSLGLAANKKV